MILFDIIFIMIVIIVARLSYIFGHFQDFIWMFLAALFGFYTSLRLIKYSERRERRKELSNLSNTRLNILWYLKEEIEHNITYMKDFTNIFSEVAKNNFIPIRQDWDNVKTSFRTTDIWNRFIAYSDDFEFIKLIDDEYIKYINIHKAIETFRDKVYEMVEKYGVNASTDTIELNKIKVRYELINFNIQRCINADNSSERCLQAIKEKLKGRVRKSSR